MGFVTSIPLDIVAQQPIDVTRFENEIRFDGIPDEKEWEEISPLPMTVFSPVYEGQPTESTEIRLAYDNRFFYVSANCFDSNPQGIQGNTLIRDRNTAGDFLNVMIDSFNDNENFLFFGTMPSGVRIDAEIPQDGEAIVTFNQDWNTFWDVKVHQDEQGWYVEMRIPFSSLRFKKKSDEIIFGFSTNRLIGRKNERHLYPNIPPNWPNAVWKASQAAKLTIKDVEVDRPIYLIPYTLTGYYNDGIVNSGFPNNNGRVEIGGDIKLGLSNNLTMDLTVNNDFAQVESDNFQSNLTRFSLFFPEKRQFFQERAGIFNFSLSGNNRIFNSRVIGLSESGQPQRVFGGVRLIGRQKGFDIGLLNMHTDAPDSVGSLNFGTLRMRQRIFNLNSYVGAILTSVIDENGQTNAVYGLDALIRTHKQNFLYLKGGESLETYESSTKNHFAYLKWEKRAFQGFGYSLELDQSADNFNPGLGFIQRRNLILNQSLMFGHFPNESKNFRSINVGFANSFFLRNSDTSLETRVSKVNLDFTFLTGAQIGIEYNHNYDEVSSPFSFSEKVQIIPANYQFNNIRIWQLTNPNNKFTFASSFQIGKYYDSKRTVISIYPGLILSKHYEISVVYTYDQVHFPDLNHKVRADIFSISSLAAFDLHWSFMTLVQYNKLTDQFGINARLRYNRKEANDLFIVMNYLTNSVPNLTSDTSLPNQDNWSIVLKYTHAFSLR